MPVKRSIESSGRVHAGLGPRKPIVARGRSPRFIRSGQGGRIWLHLALGPSFWLFILWLSQGVPYPTRSHIFSLMLTWVVASFFIEKWLFIKPSHRKGQLAFLLTAFSVISLIGIPWSFARSPYFAEIPLVKWSPFVPQGKEWNRAAFYYAMGTVPVLFDGKPIFYTLPYAKGPPTKFPEKVIARWKMPDIKLTLEGPKTPGDPVVPARIKECLKIGLSPACASLKEALLKRHFKEILTHGAVDHWQIEWFDVTHPALSIDEAPKGLHVTAQFESTDPMPGRSKIKYEERYVLIGPRGAHQTLILQRDDTADGKRASELLGKMVRGMRVGDALVPGRLLLSRTLSQTDLNGLLRMSKPLPFVSKIAELQLTLISKFTVEPGDLYALFHLGGTGVLFLRKVIKQRDHPEWMEFLTQIDEWSAAQKSLIKSATQYAQDVAPGTDQAEQLRVLLMDAQKL